MRFKNLGSGSGGNATLFELEGDERTVRVLIDCGLTMSELNAKLSSLELSIADIDAVFITHEHSDHVGHARQLGLKSKCPIWMSQGTQLATQAQTWGLQEGQIRTAKDGLPIHIGALRISPFTVPHDAREPLQVTLSNGVQKIGLVTDLGHVSAHVIESLQRCHALILESNHDPKMLQASAYPAFLKSRIAGPQGHLSNAESAQLLKAVMHPDLQCVVAAHLSEKNNDPELVSLALTAVLNDHSSTLMIAHPQDGTPWVEVAQPQLA